MTIIEFTLLGAILLLDKYAIGEFGISQPIIAGTIIGASCGDTHTGIFVGALFQMVFLANFSIGRDVPPDAQAGGIAGCSSYFILRKINQVEPNLIVVFFFGLLTAILGSVLDIYIRRINEQLYYHFLRNKSRLSFYHLSGIFTSFLRGIILFLPLFVIVNFLMFPAITTTINQEFLMIVVVSLCIANGIYLYSRKNCLFFLILGALCSLAFFVL
ncbi:MAG: PTS sugar transporter subunit IIC [bacterium]